MKNIYNEHVYEWIKRISIQDDNKHPICPFAKNAKYGISPYDDKQSLLYKAGFFDHSFDLYLCFPTDQFMSVEKAKQIEYECNLIAKDTITLLDHPKDPGYIDGVCTSNGNYVIFLIQSKKGLLDARKLLRKTSYYDNWDSSYYEKIVGNKV